MSQKEKFLQSCLVLDTETNSDQWAIAEVVESGFVIRENNDWTIFQELHKPVKSPIPPKVESICYITNKMVEDKQSFIENNKTFQGVIDGYANGYLVAHNYFYDMKVLENNGIDTSKHVWLCSWRLAKKLFNDVDYIEETNLPYLRFALDLDVPIELRCHRAGNDAFITAKLLEVLVDLMENMNLIDQNEPYGPQIANYMSAPIIFKKMPIGKHKGELMDNVPLSYIQWALKNMDSLKEDTDSFDSDFAATITNTLESRGLI